MSHLPYTLLAYFLNSISVTINKFLLNKTIPDPFVYIFYVSIFSLILIPALPFSHLPKVNTLILASVSTLLWTAGAYFMFKALKIGAVSRVIPIIGTLIPLILLIDASRNSAITINQTWAILLLVLGLIFITILDWKGKLTKAEFIFEVLSATLFAISYILLHLAYLQADFFSVLVWSRVVLIPPILLILIVPQLKHRITDSKGHHINILGKSGILFLIGQLSGGASELLLLFSISLANPALVNSLQGTQYIFLIIFGLFLKEKYTKFSILIKLIGIIFIGLGFWILAFSQAPHKPQVGITFSPKYATELNLNPQITFTRLLDELKVKSIRLPVYWDEVEAFPNNLNFSKIDYYLDIAEARDIKIILVLGYKQPRWPECFDPPWVKNLIRSERDLRILNLVNAEIDHFKKYQNIIAWQVENEPFLPFGNCDIPTEQTKERIKKEIQIVKSSDSRPILLTDSGELGFWFPAISSSDIFGTTVYRTVWNPILGMFNYPLPPVFYNLKNNLIRFITNKNGSTIVSELQMEPWIRDKKLPSESDLSVQIKDFPPSRLLENLKYTKETNFSQIYLWGAEWWYFMEKQGHPEYLEKAKELFRLFMVYNVCIFWKFSYPNHV